MKPTIPLLAAFSTIWPAAASACSCLAQPDWSVEKALGEGAVFAEVTHAGEEAVPAAPGLRVFIAQVHRGIALESGGTIRIETAMDSAACGITLTPGTPPRWLALHPLDQDYSADLCSQQGTHDVTASEWQAFLEQRVR